MSQIEEQRLIRFIRPVRPQPIARTGAKAGNQSGPDMAFAHIERKASGQSAKRARQSRAAAWGVNRTCSMALPSAPHLHDAQPRHERLADASVSPVEG